jgi:large-conductance mechanosensitive channel
MSIFFKKFYKDFQEYVYINEVLVAASGYTIGIASYNFLKSLIDEIIEPVILFIFKNMIIISPIYNKYNNFFNSLGNFIWLTLVWIITIFLSFFVIEYILNRKIIGLSSIVVSNKEKNDFIKNKIVTKEKANIIPNDKDKKEIEIEEQILKEKHTNFIS